MFAKQREVSSESLISGWKYLPYQSLFEERKSAELLYLSRFSDFSAAHLSADDTGDRMALIRALHGETEILGLRCARLEPMVLNVKDELSSRSITESGRFIRDVLTRVNEKEGFEHISCVVDCADNHTQLALYSAGFNLADTILSYHLDLATADLGADEKFVREVRSDDVEALKRTRPAVNKIGSQPPSRWIPDLTVKWDLHQVGNLIGQSDQALTFDNAPDCVSAKLAPELGSLMCDSRYLNFLSEGFACEGLECIEFSRFGPVVILVWLRYSL